MSGNLAAADPPPKLSVIIPVYNGGDAFRRCIAAVRSSAFSSYEIIVVDDGSTDGSAAHAEAAGALVVKPEGRGRRGAAEARNRGAARARGEVLFFTDADVVVAPDTLARVNSYFEKGGEHAVIGSYTAVTPAPGYFSKFKNIHHHYIHQISREEAATFWTGCGAVARDVFFAVGGFDKDNYTGATIEDIEFGYRLYRAGYRIRLAKEIQVTHLKTYSLWSLMKSDIFYRAVPWTTLMLTQKHFRSDLNTTPTNAGAVLSAAALVGGLLAAPFWPPGLAAAAAGAVVFVIFTYPFNRYVKRYFGWGFTLTTVAMSAWYFFYAGVGCGLGILSALAVYARRLRSRRPKGNTP